MVLDEAIQNMAGCLDNGFTTCHIGAVNIGIMLGLFVLACY